MFNLFNIFTAVLGGAAALFGLRDSAKAPKAPPPPAVEAPPPKKPEPKVQLGDTDTADTEDQASSSMFTEVRKSGKSLGGLGRGSGLNL